MTGAVSPPYCVACPLLGTALLVEEGGLAPCTAEANCRVLCANCHRKQHHKMGEARPGGNTEGRERPRRRWLTTLKEESDGCVNCEESSPACLDYHHTGPKVKGISEMVARRYALTRVREELGQCKLLCANCHRMEHHG